MAPSANKLKLFDTSQLPADKNFLIAFSGGSDSTALLHFLAHQPEFRGRLRAIHINHQLQQQSDNWQTNCEESCSQWAVPLISVRVELPDDSENTARDARRLAFMAHLTANETLLTGHHEQDQVETVLFRLLRGTGLKGLSGMEQHSQLPNGSSVFRPMLQTSKEAITEYLNAHMLKWIEDPSNQSDRYSRNHIRNHILPSIQNYSTQASQAVIQTAEHLKNSHDLLLRLMPNDNPAPKQLAMDVTFLHHWIQKKSLHPPTQCQLKNFIENCQQAASHKHPELITADYRMVLWQDHVYLLKNKTETKDVTLPFHKTIDLPCGGQLNFSRTLKNLKLNIQYQVTGERLKLVQHTHHKTVKKLFQEARTPPWEKETTPFVYHGGELLAVGNWCTESFTQLLKQNNCQYSWQKAEQIL